MAHYLDAEVMERESQQRRCIVGVDPTHGELPDEKSISTIKKERQNEIERTAQKT